MLPGIINVLDLFNGQLAVWFQTRFLVSHLFFRWIKLAQLSLLLRSLSCQMRNLNIIRVIQWECLFTFTGSGHDAIRKLGYSKGNWCWHQKQVIVVWSLDGFYFGTILFLFYSCGFFFVVLELYRTRDAGCIISPLPPIYLGKTAHSV